MGEKDRKEEAGGGEEMSEWVLGMVVAGEFDIALIFLY